MVFLGISPPFFCHKDIHKQNIEIGSVVNNNQEVDINNQNFVIHDELSYTVEGTITEIIFGNISKTSRVEKLVMYLYLRTADSSNIDLKFRKRPVF